MRHKFHLMITIILTSCAFSGERITTLNPSLIEGIAKPFQLELEVTRIPMNEYISDPTRIDSVSSDGPFNYEVDNSSIVLYGRPKKPLYVLHFWSNGIRESVLLKRTKPKLHNFLYIGKANGVKVKGDFNKWDPNKLILDRNGNSFSDYMLLRPGRYEYLFVVDGRDVLDPYNKDSIEREGSWNSVLTIQDADARKIPMLDVSSTSGRTLYLSVNKTDNVYAFWQNTLLTSSFMAQDDDGIRIQIPANADEMEQSAMRIWAENTDGASQALEIALRFGEVVLSED